MTLAASSTAQNFWRYVQEQGYSGSINDQLSKLLTAEGYSGPTPSSLYSLLSSLGYAGTLNERINAFEREYTIRYGSGAVWTPLTLFAASEVGVWYDPSDFSTMFQDSAGTTPVTAVGDPVGKILDKSGNLKHATQATAASRPILGRHPVTGIRNLLKYTEDFSNAVWNKAEVTVSANAAVAPDGTTTADTVTATAAALAHRVFQNPVVSETGRTLSAYVKANGYNKVAIKESVTTGNYASFDLSTASVITNTAGVTAAISSVGSGWYRVSMTLASEVACGLQISILAPGYTTGDPNGSVFVGDGTSGLYIWGAQVEAGSAATAYQKVVAATEVTEAGVESVYYLKFDGTDDFLQTAAIDFTATDAISVFAGMRKSSDAARGTIVELTASAAANNGSFHLAAPNAASATIAWESKGTVLADAVASSGVAAPLTAVLTGTSDISGDTAILRVNGAQADADTGDQGTGNLSNAVMYIGRRGGSTLPFKGNLYSLTILGRTATAAEIAAAESYVAGKTGVTL